MAPHAVRAAGSRDSDVLVIGAGLSGLATALALEEAGRITSFGSSGMEAALESAERTAIEVQLALG